MLILERKTEMIVRGVYRDIPENTMFKADFVVSVHKEGGYKDGAGWGGMIFLCSVPDRRSFGYRGGKR